MCILVSARLDATAAPDAPAPMISTSTGSCFILVLNSLFRHCERSKAIHRAASGGMDCFVASLLAMTGMGSGLTSYKRLVEVDPFQIESLNQGQLFRATPGLDLLFPSDGLDHGLMY